MALDELARRHRLLARFTDLTELSLGVNNISDIGPLALLNKLTSLDLRWNQINDISPLASLTNLTELDLEYNQISDFRPVDNRGIDDLEGGFPDENLEIS